jgi:hypothetical protein
MADDFTTGCTGRRGSKEPDPDHGCGERMGGPGAREKYWSDRAHFIARPKHSPTKEAFTHEKGGRLTESDSDTTVSITDSLQRWSYG